MKIGAIIEVTAGPVLVTTWSRPSGGVVRSGLPPRLEAVIALIAALNGSRHGAGRRLSAADGAESSTYGVEHAGR